MSATTARKTAPPSTPGRDAASKVSATPASSAARRGSTPNANASSTAQRPRPVRSGVNGSPVSARASVRKPGAPSNLSMSASQTDTNDEDAREEQAAFLTDLKERLHKAEIEAEERQKQVDVLNARLDEALREQAKLEERAHEEEERAESLEADKQKLTRQQRELEGIYEAERAQTMKDKDEAQTRVDELQETIQRLKETMAKKNVEGSDGEDGKLSRTCASTTISLSLGTMNRTDTVQQASAITPPATAPRRT